TDEEKALYKLIWQRAVASQLADAIYAVRTVTLDGDAQGLAVKFNASGRTVTSPGWMAVYSDDTEEDEEAAASNPIPALSDGDELTAESGRMLTKKTKPPARFTESTLVAEMERMGIGRPSTYAAILENISGRSYVTTDAKGYLIPSEIGASVRDALVGRFKFAELDYTRGLEEQLDMIAEAKADYLPVVSAAWAALDDELGQLSTANIPVAHPCPACGKALSRRKGQYGFFWSCTGWPECDTKLPDNKGKPGERKAPPPPSGIPCPKCGKDLARRQGVSKPKAKGQKGRPYDFYSCTGYPKCDATYQTGEDGKPNLT
ncbi:DNA topoisomerase, partial [Escherichia coli]